MTRHVKFTNLPRNTNHEQDRAVGYLSCWAPSYPWAVIHFMSNGNICGNYFRTEDTSGRPDALIMGVVDAEGKFSFHM
jgi:hypothetical protein